MFDPIIRIYQNHTVQTVKPDKEKGLLLGEDSRCDYRFDRGSCPDTTVRFFYEENCWRISCKGDVRCDGKKVREAKAGLGDTFLLNPDTQLALQLILRRKTPAKTISLENLQEISIGRREECALQLKHRYVSGNHAKLYLLGDAWHLCDVNSTNGTFLNGKPIKDEILRAGDTIYIGPYELIFTGAALEVYDYGIAENILSKLPEKAEETLLADPHFTRSPRLLQANPSAEIEIEAAPSLGGKPEINWISVFLPLIGTFAASLILSLVTGGVGMLFSIPMMATGVIVTICNHKRQKKKFAGREDQLREKYRAYLGKCEEKLQAITREQRNIALYQAQAPEQCVRMAEHTDRRLWERMPADADFLSLRIGLGEAPLCASVKTPKVGFVLDEDDYTHLPQRLADKYRTVKDIPILCDLYQNPGLGVIGARKDTVSAIHALTVQAATYHGYDDLKIVVLFPEEERTQWTWMRWLPHTFNDARTLRYMACDDYNAGMILEPIAEELKQRAAGNTGSGWEKTAPKIPHYLFIIADPSLLHGQPVADYLLRKDLGVSCVMPAANLSQLPNGILQIMDFSGGAQNAQIYLREHADRKVHFQPDFLPVSRCEAFARSLAPLRLPQRDSTQLLPGGITFLEGHRIQRPEQLDLADYWANSCNYKSMAVPIGIRANGEPFYFDIHEKKHGPHGLVAGMTGSGKSEMVQSWLLSMAVQFSPQDAAFVLIDFKGTGLIQPFLDLPHLAGTISDLDTDISRNLIALKSELQRRKELFDRAGVKDISNYLKLYRAGKVTESLPYLFVVIDEYAEFKAKFPDFTAEVNTLFRTGRSLGVHIILLTQNPSGIVSEQSENNVRFRWCLKVASTSASKEMLGGHDEAAYITNPGRAYVRVGSDEVFEPIQSFYSGADYQPERSRKSAAEPLVSRVALNGSKTLFREPREENRRSHGKEIDAVVRSIREYTTRNHIPDARHIWQDRLPEQVYLPDLLQQAPPQEEGELLPVVALMDDPHTQSRHIFRLPLSTDGHAVIYGAPGTGKTVFLQTLAASICSQMSPQDVNLYMMDFRGWNMQMFRDFPHVSAIALGDEEDKLEKITETLDAELTRRKQLFSKAGAGNLRIYRRVTGEHLPYLVLMADGFQYQEINMTAQLQDFFVRIGRDGGTYGIYLVLTCGSTMALGYKLVQSIKTSIALQLNDPSEYTSVVGRTEGLYPANLPGRGLYRGERIMEFQTALPAEEEAQGTYMGAIHRLAEELTQRWGKRSATERPLMMENLPYGSIPAENGGFVLGYIEAEARAAELDLIHPHHLLISGMPGSGKTTLLKSLLRQMQEIPGARMLLYGNPEEYADFAHTAEFLKDAEHADQFLAWLSEELGSRRAAKQAGEEVDFQPIYLLIDGFKSFYEGISQQSANRLRALIMAGAELGVALVAADDAGALSMLTSYMEPVTMLLAKGPAVLLGGKAIDHTAIACDMRQEDKSRTLKQHEGWMQQTRTVCRFRMMNAQ